MNPSGSDDWGLGGPTTEALAGRYVLIETEEDLSETPCAIPGQKPVPTCTDARGPTPDDLAGVYLQVEGEEDLTVGPPPSSR
jgi:hypothetical protein